MCVYRVHLASTWQGDSRLKSGVDRVSLKPLLKSQDIWLRVCRQKHTLRLGLRAHGGDNQVPLHFRYYLHHLVCHVPSRLVSLKHQTDHAPFWTVLKFCFILKILGYKYLYDSSTERSLLMLRYLVLNIFQPLMSSLASVDFFFASSSGRKGRWIKKLVFKKLVDYWILLPIWSTYYLFGYTKRLSWHKMTTVNSANTSL